MSGSSFSYAQAAKGQLASQPAASLPTSNQSQASSVTGSQSRDANTSTGTRDPSVAVSTTSNEIDSSRSVRSTSAKPETRGSDGADTNKEEHNTSASAADSIDSSKVTADQSSVDGFVKGTELRGRSANVGSDAAEQHDGKRSKKPKKGKSPEKDSDAEAESTKEGPAPKVELSEAPIPAVNPWHLRQQAQKAKVIEQGSQATTASAPHSQAVFEPRIRSTHGEAAEGTKPPVTGRHGSRRDGDSAQNGGSKRSGPRGARAQEKQTEATLVASNPASWPTPDTATHNSKTQQQAVPEKLEKAEKDDGAASKPKQKEKWVQLENFVPTVKFETALPGRGRGGRVGGSRGGRDIAGGSHAVNSADRAQEPNAGSRTNSGSKRGHGEGVNPREGRKNAAQTDPSKLPKEPVPDNTSAEQPKSTPSGVVNGTAQEATGAQPANPSRQPEETARHSDSQKDIRTQNNRDGHHQGQNGSNHRGNDRPRGGGRGRGGPNHSNSNSNTNGLSHHGQQAFSTPHQSYQYQPNGARGVSHYSAGYPVSYQFPAQAGSTQRRATNGNRRHGSGRAPSMVPMGLPYDPNMYAPPTGGYSYEASNLLPLAQTQVEYYFSVDNCVKDWYLRKHMDSQGFVPIHFIAQFNRMRELLVDITVLRQACAESTVLELVMGNDGVERVRVKEGWEKWVIPDMSLRDPSARHSGPSSWQQFTGGYQPPMMSPPYPGEVPQVFSPTGEHGFSHYPNGSYGLPPLNVPVMNGINGHAARSHESQLSASVPEFSPSGAPASNGLEAGSQKGAPETEGTATKQPNGVSSKEYSSSSTNGVTGEETPATNVEVLQSTHGVEVGIEAH